MLAELPMMAAAQRVRAMIRAVLILTCAVSTVTAEASQSGTSVAELPVAPPPIDVYMHGQSVWDADGRRAENLRSMMPIQLTLPTKSSGELDSPSAYPVMIDWLKWAIAKPDACRIRAAVRKELAGHQAADEVAVNRFFDLQVFLADVWNTEELLGDWAAEKGVRRENAFAVTFLSAFDALYCGNEQTE